MDARMAFEKLDKGQIGALVGPLKDVAKIAAGLMRMDQQDEMKVRPHGESLVYPKTS